MTKYPVRNAKKKNMLPERGSKVKIKKRIMSNDQCGGFLVKPEYIDSRRPNENGEYLGYVPGAGGDVWWIKHEDGTVGAYTYEELTDVKN